MMKGVAGRITEWVRPQVPEASDGILTSAGICEGFAGAGVGTKVLIFAGFAGARGWNTRRGSRRVLQNRCRA